MAHVNAVLEARNLSCGYGGVPVCGRVNFSIQAGDILGVVGFNGTGKSTVLRSVAGRQEPLEGHVQFDARPRSEGSTRWRRAVAAVFDDDAWFPGLTVTEHLNLVATAHGIADPISAVEHELDFFGLAERSHAFPEALSSGQRRRLLLAAAMIRPARLLLFDEPEQRLDPAMVSALGERILTAQAQGCAAVVVTHDPDFLRQIAQRCLVIDDDVRQVTPHEGALVIQTQRP
ncbi:ABC transporter ATP-binding protein [Kocuria sp.]|uniref:ABC transporter ATP-binding protein n=1 Tax=Kocuria sp. TaxID=1871328 RepID=UPI0026E0A764|nr:ABC transporter ATP-binding protein [Kocuria sp.]MDO5618502.1 ABC transporter ATP-binding protein [Kocuria sp.]